MPSALDKLVFEAAQAARVWWFFGQKLLAARVSRPVPLPEPLRGRPMPDKRRILADLWALIEQDWRNIEAGYYARLARCQRQAYRERPASRHDLPRER